MEASLDNPSRSTAFILVPEDELHAHSTEKDGAASAAGLEDAALLAGDRDRQTAPSRSTALVLLPKKELRALSVEKESAHSLPRHWIYIAAAILIVVGSLAGAAGYLAGARDLAALQSLPALQKFDPPPETMAKAPAAGQTEHGESAVAQAAAVAPPPAAAGVTQPAENALAVAEPPAVAAAPTTPQPSVARLATPAKKPQNLTADNPDDKSEKQKPQSNRHAKVAKPRSASAAPQALANFSRAAQKALASLLGAVKGLAGLDSAAHP